MGTKPKLAILGASGAIGRALTAAAMAEGWRVIALDLKATQAAYPPPVGVSAYEVDLREPETIAAAPDAEPVQYPVGTLR